MEKNTVSSKELKCFGLIMGIVLILFTFVTLVKTRKLFFPFTVLALLFFLLAIFSPVQLRLFYIFWIRLGNILGVINSKIILCLVYYLIFFPLGMGMKLFGIDLLERKIQKNALTYWKKQGIESSGTGDYERQF